MTATATDISTRRKPTGRKDTDGREAVIKTGELKERIGDLVSLHNSAIEAKTKYGEAVKAVAEKSGLLASVVRKFVAARAASGSSRKRLPMELGRRCGSTCANT